MFGSKFGCAGVVLGAALALAGAAQAQVQCEPPGGFNAWIDSFKRHAVAQGISPRTAAALDGLTVNRQVIQLDRDQRAFRLSFEQWIAQRVTPRINRGRQMLNRHRDLLARIERQYGVPGPVIVAIWGLESDFGANSGNMSIIRSLATLAHDCRRTEMFQGELMAALRILDRGDLKPVRNARRLGRRGGPDPVPRLQLRALRRRLRRQRPARPDRQHSRRARVHRQLPAFLRLASGPTMGRGHAQFPGPEGMEQRADLPARHRAVRQPAGGRPAGGHSQGGGGLSAAQARELQQLLAQRGHDIGAIDGVIGPRTRAAAAAERRRLGLPDGALDEAFLARLRQ
jgi:hypothetical protein